MNFTRIALAATILSSKRSQDGISKLIYKSDFDKMRGKDTTQKLDEMLATMWPEAVKVQPKGYICFGKACVNMILHLLQKEKLAKSEQYNAFTDIVTEFQQELTGQAPLVAHPAASKDPSSSTSVEDLVNCSGKDIAKMQNSHITVGKRYLAQKSKKMTPYFNILCSKLPLSTYHFELGQQHQLESGTYILTMMTKCLC